MQLKLLCDIILNLTDLEAMGIPVSSTGPIPENLMSLSSLVGVQLRGKVAEAWTPLDSPPKTQQCHFDLLLATVDFR